MSAFTEKLEKGLAALNLTTDSPGLSVHEKKLDIVGFIGRVFALLSGYAHATPKEYLAAIQRLELHTLDWSEIEFGALYSITDTDALAELKQRCVAAGLSYERAHAVIWDAVLLFLEAWADGDKPTDEFFDNIVSAVIANAVVAARQQDAAPELEPNEPVLRAPEILHPAQVARVFQPAPFSIELATKFDIAVVKFVGQLAGFRYSHEISGFCFDNGLDTLTVLLETGELVFVPKSDFISTAISADPEDYEDVSPLLMLNLRVLCQNLLRANLISKTQSDFICSEQFGKFKKPVAVLAISGERAAGIERVFKDSRTGAISPKTSGADSGLRCKVTTADSENYYVALQVYSGTKEPYLTSRITQIDTDGCETVVMRADSPRLFTVFGAYVFPLKNSLVSVSILPAAAHRRE